MSSHFYFFWKLFTRNHRLNLQNILQGKKGRRKKRKNPWFPSEYTSFMSSGFPLPRLSRSVLFNKMWMWKFSSNHKPLGAGAFCSSNITRYAKPPHPISPASRGSVTPELHPYPISARPRGLWRWSMWTVSRLFPLDKQPSRSNKCHSPCPLAPVPTILANRAQRLSSPFSHRSHLLSVSAAVPAQAFYMSFLD